MQPTDRTIKQQLALCMLRDEQALKRRWQALRKKPKDAAQHAKQLAEFNSDLEASIAVAAARRERCPAINYLPDLPVSERRVDIAEAIAKHQVVIVCGETGSGKTTQLPKICLELGRGQRGLIGHTQPRRIAARSVAARIAEELQSPLGELAGYKIRFNDVLQDSAYIKLMTDGILLAETQGDRFLNQYDTLIIDEAHERSLNIDFLLGVLKKLLPKRPDLKLIITSATIDPQRFANYFGTADQPAPIVQVSGRSYPVELRYRPPAEGIEQQESIGRALEELPRQGDVLVFLPGERDIRDTAKALTQRVAASTEVLPLFGRLSAAEQQRIFHPGGGKRRVILATNVAETSITVPGIRYVIDTGLARISRYSYRSKVQRLPIEPISQASANQRAGRCGRVAAGICIRLYDEDDFAEREAFTPPEILRTNLASVILQMHFLKLGEVANFPFIEPPDSRLIRDGEKLLEQLGALSLDGRLTPAGRVMARLPVDPRIGRMLVAAEAGQCLPDMLTIAAGLSVQDPRERPLDKQQAADEAQQLYQHKRSDFVSLLLLWADYQEQRKALSNSALRRYCQSRYLNVMRLREWQEVRQQLREQCRSLGWALPKQTHTAAAKEDDELLAPAEYEALHKALLHGLVDHIGQRLGKNEYLAARGSRFYLFPGSGLSKQPPAWLLCAELVETARTFARSCAAIEPEWVEAVAPQQVKKHWLEPYWSAKRGEAYALEQVTLYGLQLINNRRVRYAPINLRESRELLIREGLVPGRIRTRGEFLKHNLALVDDGLKLEAKARRRDLMADELAQFRFYDERLPKHIDSLRSFEQWRKQAEANTPKLLFMDSATLYGEAEQAVTAADFPDSWPINGVPIALEYHFDPADPADGVTAVIPLALLNQLNEAEFEWQVPGLRQEKITALIRGLPKSLRRNFVPAPAFAQAVLEAVNIGSKPLLATLTAELKRMTGITVPDTAWCSDNLPLHLQFNFRVINAKDEILGEARSLEALREQLGGRAQQAFASGPKDEWQRDGLLDWSVGDLPTSVTVERAGFELPATPSLVDKGHSVALQLIDDPDKAEPTHRAGVSRLYHLALAKEIKYLSKNLPLLTELTTAIQKLPPRPSNVPKPKNLLLNEQQTPREVLLADLVQQSINQLFLQSPLPRGEAEFNARLAASRSQLVATATELAAQVQGQLKLRRSIIQQLDGKQPLAWLENLRDIREQLDQLVYRGFISATEPARLAELPRYLRGMLHRLDKLADNPPLDTKRLREFKPLWAAAVERLSKAAEQAEVSPALWAALSDYRWALEEYRISLFAQTLGTAYPISAKRLHAQWLALPN